ncbi:MAG: hypothetical protein JJ863_10285 [Deltaproteobacteria bacterium]|nr:hypothetical protein [Deltaproteobacteria bacterium]
MTRSVLLALVVLAACGDDSGPDTPDAAFDAAPTDLGPPPAPSGDRCERVRPGVGSDDAVAIGLSRAHATARFFRMAGGLLEADRALMAGLAAHGLSEDLLDGYADELDDVCVLEAAPAPRPVQVEELGWATRIRPGVTAERVETTATTVVIDLRDVTVDEATYLRASLESAIGTFTPLRHGVRRREGMTSELGEVGAPDTYQANGGNFDPEAWSGPGTAETRLVLTSARMAPAAAELALALRLGGHAWLVGEDVVTAVAEMHWSPVTTRGLAVHATELVDRASLERLPDYLPADVRSGDALAAAEALAPTGPPPPVSLAELPDERATFAHPDARAEQHEVDVDRPGLQAAALILHGSLRRFFPYFDVVPDRIDERLIEGLELLSTLDLDDRSAVVDWVRHLLNAVDDGHGFVFDFGATAAPEAPSHLPLALELVGEALLVYASDDPSVEAGDEVVSIGGESVASLYERYAELVSAASEGYRRDLVVRRLVLATTDTTVVVRAPTGEERTVTLAPILRTEHLALLRALTGRSSGPLGDLGRPDVHYINLDRSWVEHESTDVLALLSDAATSATGVIIDMRGYPRTSSFTWLQEMIGRVTGSTSMSARFEPPVWFGPDRLTFVSSQQTWPAPEGPALEVPVMWLVGPHTVSAAENISQIVVGADAVTVVGRQSASTNGNITGVELPGRLVATFTGMRVLDPDGDRFHGVGIVPDIEVEPTAQAIADGRDEIIEAALAALD